MSANGAPVSNSRQKVLVVYPWGGGQAQYMRGFVGGLAKVAETTLVTSYSYNHETPNCEVKKYFFPLSDRMKRSKRRILVRGAEYLFAWAFLLKLVARGRFDIVHIQWLLHYDIDKYALRLLKRCGVKIVYTAHNAVPHSNPENHLSGLLAVYKAVDLIVVHGAAIKDEILEYFPELEEATFYTQPHGTYGAQDKSFNRSAIPDRVERSLRGRNKIALMFGMQFHNKGSDRILRYWESRAERDDALLILAGRTSGDFPELPAAIRALEGRGDFLYIEGFVPDNLLNFLIDSCHIIFLPYRHASMSGVVFTAAEFEKPILATRVGCFSEYLDGHSDSLLVENQDSALREGVDMALDRLGPRELSEMGRVFGARIGHDYSWDRIASELVSHGYSLL